MRVPAILRRRSQLLLVPLALAASMAPLVAHAQTVTLRPLADSAGLTFGAAIDADALSDESYRALLIEHVNSVSTRNELSMAMVQPEPGSFDFSRADVIADFAAENDMAMRGHELIGNAVPDWVTGGSWTADTLTEVLRAHITAVVSHFRDRNPGVVAQWDVVGEAVLPDGTLRPTIWQQVIGDGYLRIAFDAARAADPDAQLFYDDFYDDLAVTQDAAAIGVDIVPGANADRTTCDAVPKCVGVRDRMTALLAEGAPIDGVGIRSHLFSPDPADLAQLTEWVDDLGLRWAVTEFDVPLPVTEIANAQSLDFQAQVYASALAACVDADNCDTFVTWGITDRFSTIPAETGGAFGGALWLDANDVAKPAFDALADVLTLRPTTVPTTSTSQPTVSAPSTTAPPSAEADSEATGVGVAIAVGACVLGAIAVAIVFARRRRSGQAAR